VATRACFPDTSLKVSQKLGGRHVACIELHNSIGHRLRRSEAPKPDRRRRMADSYCPHDVFGHRMQGLSRRTLLGYQVPLRRRERLAHV
jgi:hypothetical protein